MFTCRACLGGIVMNSERRHHRIFGAGDAFRTADGVIYRITRAVTVNGVDLIAHEIIRDAAEVECAAVPVEDFANMLAARGAVLIPDPAA